jgi:transposase, IS5 family
LKQLYRRAQQSNNSIRKSKTKKERKERERIKAYSEYIEESEKFVERAKQTLLEMGNTDINNFALIYAIKDYISHAERQIDQIRRRVMQGEKIPHEEKVFSIFEEHTEWISKGKAGVPQELGVRVCIIEDQYRFILNHEVMEGKTDEKVTVSIVESTIALYPELGSCSFDKGFYSPENKIELEKILEKVILPRKGKLTEKEKAIQEEEEYKILKRKHSAVEAGISALENHGLDLCPDHGIDGFKRYVALSIVGRNLQNLGNILYCIKNGNIKGRKNERHKLKKNAA